MLHLANGESTAQLLRAAQIDGTVASADEILMEGPLPNALQDANDWRERALYLERYLEIGSDDYVRGAQMRQHLLARALEEDEAVLWFEEDVWCQLNYLQALSWLAPRTRSQTRLSLVCPPTERLGELEEQRLTELFAERRAVEPSLLDLAEQLWPVIAAPDPSALNQAIAEVDFSAWPLLRDGLRRQLARLPDVETGLSVLEAAVLEAAARGALSFSELFPRASRSVRDYGATDLQLMRYVLDLAQPQAPMLDVRTGNGTPVLSDEGWKSWRITVTELGHAVLNRETNYMNVAHPDRYVGGVHVTRACRWRWDGNSVVTV